MRIHKNSVASKYLVFQLFAQELRIQFFWLANHIISIIKRPPHWAFVMEQTPFLCLVKSIVYISSSIYQWLYNSKVPHLAHPIRLKTAFQPDTKSQSERLGNIQRLPCCNCYSHQCSSNFNSACAKLTLKEYNLIIFLSCHHITTYTCLVRKFNCIQLQLAFTLSFCYLLLIWVGICSYNFHWKYGILKR